MSFGGSVVLLHWFSVSSAVAVAALTYSVLVLMFAACLRSTKKLFYIYSIYIYIVFVFPVFAYIIIIY